MGNYTVVTVDDEKYIHAGLDKLIDWESLGFERIGEAYNGREGAKLIRARRPHLVLTDIRMPLMDGLEMLKEISGDDYMPQVIILSGYNDFSYARQAMRYGVKNYVLKPIDEDELIPALKEIRVEIDRREEEVKRESVEFRYTCSALIRRLISGLADGEELEEMGAILKTRGDVRYGLVSFPRSGDKEISRAEDVIRRHLWNRGVFGALDRIYTESPGLYGILFDEEDFASAGPEEKLLSDLLIDWSREWGELPVLALGGSFDDLSGLKASYLQAKAALAEHFHGSRRGGLVRYNDMDGGMDRIIRDAVFFPGLLEGIENHDSRAIEFCLDRQFREFRRRRSAPEVINLWLGSLATDISRVLVELDGGPDSRIREFMGYRFDPGLIGSDDLREYVRGVCLHGAVMLEDLRRVNKTGVIRPILEFLKREYASDVSLKALGERFGMNPVYLGQLFKNTMEVSFKQYVRDLRMEEAKRLLNRTDLKVYEVARSVGYNDRDYFSRQFELVVGCTPGEYGKKGK